MPATNPWVNNRTAPTGKNKFGRPIIPDVEVGPGGMPQLPKGAFQEDTDIPWRDLRYEHGIEKLIGAGTGFASALDKLVESRGQNAENIVRDALAKSSGPVMGQADIDKAFAAQADRVGAGFNDDVASLRDYLGASGVTGGGYAAGLGTTYQLARMGQITNARRDVELEAAKLNADKKMADFNNTLSLASIVNRDPSMIGMDWIQNILDVRFNQLGVEKQEAAADEANKAAKRAGTLQGIGAIAGGLGSLLG